MPMSPETMGVLNGEPQQESKGDPTFILTDWVKKNNLMGGLVPDDIREQLTEANTAFSQMLKGATAGKRYEALAARRQWEGAATGALQANGERLAQYDQIWNDPQTNMQEKMQAIRGAAMQRGDTAVAQLVASPEQFTTFGKYFDMMAKQQQDAEQATAMLDQKIKEIEKKLPAPKEGGAPGIDSYMNDGMDDPTLQ